jgi:hypothetical protein
MRKLIRIINAKISECEPTGTYPWWLHAVVFALVVLAIPAMWLWRQAVRLFECPWRRMERPRDASRC